MTERNTKLITAPFLLVFLFGFAPAPQPVAGLADEVGDGSRHRKPFHATVIKIIDADTLDVRDGKGIVERVRVYGIDGPERWEPCHELAAGFARENLLNRTVKIIPQGRGKYGRLLGFVMMDRKSLGLELVKGGLARVYSNGFAPKNHATYKRYQLAQIHAMSGHFGIWGNCEM